MAEYSLRNNLSVGTRVRFSAQNFSDAKKLFFAQRSDTDLRKNVIALATYKTNAVVESCTMSEIGYVALKIGPMTNNLMQHYFYTTLATCDVIN